jgi:selenocysteine lyase/cysteine desulfurase
VTTSLVSFYNGFRIPLDDVVAAVRDKCGAVVALDVTQALGRIPLDVSQVDLIVSSTHKWILASHGGGLVGVPTRSAEQFTTHAGGWFHLEGAFEADRFQQAHSRSGAISFSVGMPNYAAIYAIRAALAYIQDLGVESIDAAARPLVERCLEGLVDLDVRLLTPNSPSHLAGILAFMHPKATEIHQRLHDQNIHVMSHAGRLRVAIHFYNTMDEIESLLAALHTALRAV